MNQWRKQFKEHPLHGELAQINSLLGETSLKTDDSTIVESFIGAGEAGDCSFS